MNYFFLFCFTFSFVSLFAQNASENLQKGREAQEQSQYEEASIYLQQASDFFKKNNETENYLLSQSLLGFNLLKLNQPKKSIEFLEQNILEAQKISSNAVFWKIQNEYYIAEAKLNLGRYQLAEELVKKNIQLLLQTENSDLLAKNYNLLGIIFWQEGNTNLAIEYIEKSLEIRKTNNSTELGASYNDLGLVYTEIDLSKALVFYQKALENYQSRYPTIHAKNAILLSNIGLIEVAKKQYTEAQKTFEKSKKIWQQIYPNQSHPSEAYVINNLGRIFLEKGEYDTANDYFRQALKIYQTNYGNKHPEIASTLNFISQTDLRKGNFKESISTLQKALIANSDGFEAENIEQNPPLGAIFSSTIFLSSLMLKSDVLTQQYISKTLRLSDLKNALVCLQIADTLLTSIRQQASSNEDKLLLSKTSSQLYEKAVILCNLLANETHQREKYYTQAFYFSEKDKAIILLEAINESKAKDFGNIPTDLLKKEEDLRIDMSFIEQQIALKPKEQELKEYKSKLFQLKRNYEDFQKELEKNFPNYFDLKYSSQPVSTKDLQSKLDETTLLLDYMIGTNQIFVFVITSTKINLLSFDKDPQFDSDITYLLNAIRFNLKEAYTQMAYKLYKDIFPKRIKTKIKNIVVIQDDKLVTLPMETLLCKSAKLNKNDNFSSFDFLVKKWAFSYAYSATLWYQNLDDALTQSKDIALIAPINFENMNRLVGSEKEVKNIALLGKEKQFNVNLLVGKEAQEKTVKEFSLTNFSILHFATHGLVNEENPALSQIFLIKSENEDGNLFAAEVFNLRLNADLVTLSACEVGLGKVIKGEGIIGLGRAFLYAGADNLVVSLWQVSDESTAQLMTNFYAQKFNNSNKGYAKALQQAKLELLKNKKFSAPYYWAAFLVLGR